MENLRFYHTNNMNDEDDETFLRFGLVVYSNCMDILCAKSVIFEQVLTFFISFQ